MILNKKIARTVLIFIALVSVSFQSGLNPNIEKLLQVSQTKQNTEEKVKEVLSMYKKKYPNVSIMTWGGIEESINYQTYYAKIRQVYRSSYSDAEIKELIKLYNPKTMDQYMAKSKRVEQKLYDVGKEFGKELSAHIQARVK